MHFLDVIELPSHPTFIIELDSKKTLKSGLSIMRSILKPKTLAVKSEFKSAADQPIPKPLQDAGFSWN
ncbi:hypothetical protein CJF42_18415 [Pseudoalteromonas sp. NBT06-2]|nr:hypothetical protein CJF42_18415 [Pseudoalteromonas sp. NBT06-2]